MIDQAPPAIAQTALAQRGRAIFRRFNVYEGQAFAHHCQRLAAIARALAGLRGMSFEPGAFELIAYVHDLGLVAPDVDGPSYMHRSLALLRREFADAFDGQGAAFGWSSQEIDELLLLNHRVLAPAGASRVAEIFRQAVWVEHSRGLVRYGLSHTQARGVFARWPRLDLDRVLWDFAKRTLQKEPRTLIRGVFFGEHPGRLT